MAVTRDEVAHIAELSCLALDEARVPDLVRQLNGILEHMGVLSQVKTAGVEGTAGVGDAGLHTRVDAGPPIPLHRPLEGFAPATRDGFLIVPRLATHEGSRGAPEELA